MKQSSRRTRIAQTTFATGYPTDVGGGKWTAGKAGRNDGAGAIVKAAGDRTTGAEQNDIGFTRIVREFLFRNSVVRLAPARLGYSYDRFGGNADVIPRRQFQDDMLVIGRLRTWQNQTRQTTVLRFNLYITPHPNAVFLQHRLGGAAIPLKSIIAHADTSRLLLDLRSAPNAPRAFQFNIMSVFVATTAVSIVLGAFFGLGRLLGMSNMEVATTGLQGSLIRAPTLLIWTVGISMAFGGLRNFRQLATLVIIAFMGLAMTSLAVDAGYMVVSHWISTADGGFEFVSWMWV